MSSSGGSSPPSGAAGGVLSGTFPNPGTAQQASQQFILTSPQALNTVSMTAITGMTLTLGVGKWQVFAQVTADAATAAIVEFALVAGTAVVSSGGASGDTTLAAGVTAGRTVSMGTIFQVTTAGTIVVQAQASAAANAVAVGPVNSSPGATQMSAENLLA